MFIVYQRYFKVNVSDIKSGIICSTEGNNAFDDYIDNFEVSCWVVDISAVADMVATNGDASSVGVSILGVDFTDNLDVYNLFSFLCRDVLISDDMESISNLHLLVLTVWICVDPLVEAPQIIEVGLVPGVLVPRVAAQLAVF